MNVLVSMYGVLRTDLDAPLYAGTALVKALLPTLRVSFYSPYSEDLAKHLLRTEGVTGYAELYTDMTFKEALAKERAHISGLSMVILADPADAEYASEQGITVVMVSAKNFVRTDWQLARRNWKDIENANRLPGR